MNSNNSVVYRLWYWCQNTIYKMIYFSQANNLETDLYKKKILEQINLIRKETTKTNLSFRRFESVLLSITDKVIHKHIATRIIYQLQNKNE